MATPSQSNKRKKETVSPASSTENDDDYDYKSKKRGGERSSSFDDSGHGESIETESVSSASSDSEEISDDYRRNRAQQNHWMRSLANVVVAYYNHEDRNNKDTMEFTWIRELIYHSESSTSIDFICFDARLTAKDGKEIKDTNCRSVLLKEYGEEPKVYSLKLGPFEDIDIKHWFKWRPGRGVFYSESMMELESAPTVEKTASESEEEEDNNANDEDNDAKTEHKINWEETLTGRGCTCCVAVGVRHSAKEAVAYYNKKGGHARMKMGEIQEVFFHDVDVEDLEVCHIKFNARLIFKDGKETEWTTCQAVVSDPNFGGIKVWSFKFPSLEGNETGEWCCKKGDCKCEIPPWDENKELLKYACPDCYQSSDDEQVEDMKIKHESPEQPPEASSQGGTQN